MFKRGEARLMRKTSYFCFLILIEAVCEYKNTRYKNALVSPAEINNKSIQISKEQRIRFQIIKN